jgi:hypothetical protein
VTDELAALAAAGAAALATAMGSDAWASIRALAGRLSRAPRAPRGGKGIRQMPADDLTELTAAGGTFLVELMTSKEWPPARDHALQLFRYAEPRQRTFLEVLLDEDATALAGAPAAELGSLRQQLAAGWRRQLGRLLADRPDAAADLRELVARLRDALPADPAPAARSYSQTNIARGNATVFAVLDGNLHNHPPGS